MIFYASIQIKLHVYSLNSVNNYCTSFPMLSIKSANWNLDLKSRVRRETPSWTEHVAELPKELFEIDIEEIRLYVPRHVAGNRT